MTGLVNQHCEACTRETPTVHGEELERLLAELDPDWSVTDGRLLRRFRFPDFVRAFTRATSVAMLAEAEGHHPDMHIGWGRLDVELVTHAVSALTRNDFILAAKIDAASR